MAVVLPKDTNVNIDFPASVTFVLNSGELNFSAIVNFSYPVNAVPRFLSGTATSVPVSGSATIVEAAVNANSIFYGFEASGDTDCTFVVSYNGVDAFRYNTNIVVPNANYKAPSTGIILIPGDVIRLYVINNGTQSANFTGSLIGVFYQ